jgi:hypothetical protein
LTTPIAKSSKSQAPAPGYEQAVQVTPPASVLRDILVAPFLTFRMSNTCAHPVIVPEAVRDVGTERNGEP